MKVLVTGASGFIGKPLCAELLREGYSVIAATRSICWLSHDVDVFNIGEINGVTDWDELLEGVDVVIHLAARVHVMNDSSADPLAAFREVNVEGTAQLAKQAAASGVTRFIYISSIKVNGEYSDLNMPFDEEMKPNPQDDYGISKLEAENSLLQLSQGGKMEVVIIRPPLVYGAGVKANFANMLRVLRRKIPLPLASVKNQRSLIYVGNLVDFIAKCTKHPNAANQVFLVSDGHDLSTKELLQKSADALNVKFRLLPVPTWLIKIAAMLLGKQNIAQRLCSNLQVDISKARKLLGWKPPVSVDDGLKATAVDWLQRGRL